MRLTLSTSIDLRIACYEASFRKLIAARLYVVDINLSALIAKIMPDHCLTKNV